MSKKDLLVSIASRHKENEGDGVSKLDNTIELLYKTCYSKDNFDIQVIICNDQVDMYKKSLAKRKIVPDIIKYTALADWRTMINAQHKKMKEGYYFFVFFPDDISNLTQDWDKEIYDKKKTFEDDLFVLYSAYTDWGRDIHENMKNCYESPEQVLNLFEQNPVWTYKFGEFMYALFDKKKYKKGREIIVGLIIHYLSLKGYNRHVETNFNYKVDCTQNKDETAFTDIGKLLKRGCDDVKIIVNKMTKYLNKLGVPREPRPVRRKRRLPLNRTSVWSI